MNVPNCTSIIGERVTAYYKYADYNCAQIREKYILRR